MSCSHFCIYDVPSKNERRMICNEHSVPIGKYKKATPGDYSFLYIDRPRKIIAKNLNEQI